jgi:tetratricopeptide (TPR) repeat protein
LVGWTYACRGARRVAAAAGLVATLGLAVTGATALRGLVNPGAAAAHAFERGVEAFEDEEWKRAIEEFEPATEHASTAAAAWFNIGLCHRALHDVEAALAAHERALALEPGNARFRDAVDQLQLPAGDHAGE